MGLIGPIGGGAPLGLVGKYKWGGELEEDSSPLSRRKGGAPSSYILEGATLRQVLSGWRCALCVCVCARVVLD